MKLSIFLWVVAIVIFIIFMGYIVVRQAIPTWLVQIFLLDGVLAGIMTQVSDSKKRNHDGRRK